MCFYISMNKNAQTLASRYGLKTDILESYQDILNEHYQINAFTNPLCYVVTNSEELHAFNWGLIPHWERTPQDADKIRAMTYNARSESIFEKPSFREPIRSKRCLVPSTGYFEYHHNADSSTTPYFIYLKNTEIFSIAGIYDSWKNPANGDIINTFSIITTEANSFTAEIHNGGKNPNRMPVILSPMDEKQWIDSSLNREGIIELMKPYDASLMDAHAVRRDFLKLDTRDERVIERQ
ncbi:SOS response-associated peptidase [Prevotella sp. 10(H)]|uniref:SOS response-associated peptidase n=1 Tax=Prevotella sp. 10(H) TaxID=1158294 RepID=UPI0004A6C293|nr:SOS response-associated peptidase [Prevotella sp. 10(H)]